MVWKIEEDVSREEGKLQKTLSSKRK